MNYGPPWGQPGKNGNRRGTLRSIWDSMSNDGRALADNSVCASHKKENKETPYETNPAGQDRYDPNEPRRGKEEKVLRVKAVPPPWTRKT